MHTPENIMQIFLNDIGFKVQLIAKTAVYV